MKKKKLDALSISKYCLYYLIFIALISNINKTTVIYVTNIIVIFFFHSNNIKSFPRLKQP